ncbi:MAG TPA: MFS transporter, partial [Mycobacteriales bacterium]|nr:MFS transporter [Mycobacteriales bacterium]
WGGALIGTAATLFFLNKLSADLGWRLAFLIGPVLGLVIIYVRRNLPESPRWQIMHGREAEAEAGIAQIEGEVEASTGSQLEPVSDDKAIEIRPTEKISYVALLHALFKQYPGRSTLTAALMITQSFLYNAIFFTYAQVLTTFFHVPNGHTAYYYLAFAGGNLAGALLLGPLFDILGRRLMISATYLIAAVLLAVSAVAFDRGLLSAGTQTICWTAVFFFASAGASSAYLTVSEIFPIELRAQAIAVFFALAQGFGALGPAVYGGFVASKKPHELMLGYFLGAGVMAVGGVVAAIFGVKAERTSLEDVASPLTLVRKASSASTGATASPRLSPASTH